MEEKTLRIAMWSGPRNISTALMRAWGNRPDTFVTDEPLYAHYLQVTGANHPGAEEVIRCHEADWRKVAAWLTGPAPEGKAVWYQKHMAHHLLPQVERGWLAGLTHCFLIREPREMLASLVRILPAPALEDTGLPQQAALFEEERRRTGSIPPVLDARELLEDPEGMLRRLCAVLGVSFTRAMLAWPPGPRATDGVWAKHWYGAVEQTTGFQPYALRPEALPPRLAGLLRECEALYARLSRYRLKREDRADAADLEREEP